MKQLAGFLICWSLLSAVAGADPLDITEPAPPLPRQPVVVPPLSPPNPRAPDEPPPGGPLSIDQAVRLALEHNPDILNLAFAIGQEEAALRVAKETWYPTASVSMGGNYQSTGGVGGSGFGSLQLSESYGLTVNKTVADFGQTRARVAAAEAALVSARASLLQKQEDTALTVRQQYYTAIADAQLAVIDQASTADQQKHLAQAQAFYHEGTKARLDVAQAEASLATAQLALVQAENNRDKDYVILSVAMGLPSKGTYQLENSLIDLDPAKAAAAEAPDDDALLQYAYRERPDLLNLEAQMHTAQANLSLAHMGFNPVLSTSANASVFAAGGQNSPGFGLGVTLSLPLLDAGATAAAVQSAQAVLNGLVAQQTSLQNTIFQAVEVDIKTLHQAVTSVRVARTGAASAAEAFHLANGRYRAGLGSSLDFLDAQVANSQAQSALVTAEAQVRTAQAQLDHDIGRIDFLPMSDSQQVNPPHRSK